MTQYGAIEGGGTKFVLAVADEDNQIIARTKIATGQPEATLRAISAFFDDFALTAVGLGSFGPIDLNEDSPSYGTILNTPKTAWQGYDIVGELHQRLQVPVFATTDVNVACLGEYQFGIAQGVRSCVYFTVGTGIGAGAINQGRLIQGLAHPEMGHMRVLQDPADDFAGLCPYHRNCLEGLAAGPALAARSGQPAGELPADDRCWAIEADYLAQAANTVSLLLAPEMIIFGGGVMNQPQLLPMIRNRFERYNQGYVDRPPLTEYLQGASLHDNQGVLGCLALAQQGMVPSTVLNQ